MRLCECGCGEEAARRTSGRLIGQSMRFARGHDRRPRFRRFRGSPAERFAARVGEPDANGCRQWLGAMSGTGYGLFGIAHGRNVIAHRFAYELAHGEIPEGHDIHHLCENRACVNPDHLEPMLRSKHASLHGVRPRPGRSRQTRPLSEEI